MKLRIIVIVGIVVTYLFFQSSDDISAQDIEKVSIEVIPDTVILSSQEKVPVKVILHNSSNLSLNDVKITSFPNPLVEVEIDDQTYNSSPYEDLSWTLWLSPTNNTPFTTSLVVGVDYKVKLSEESKAVVRSLYKSISVKNRDAQISIKVNPETIELLPYCLNYDTQTWESRNSAVITLLNATDQTLNITSINISEHNLIRFKDIDSITSKLPIILNPYNNLEIKYELVSNSINNISTEIPVNISYTTTLHGTNTTIRRTLFSTFKIKGPSSIDPNTIVTQELKSSIETLNTYQPGIMYLTINNISGIPISIDTIEVYSPIFIETGYIETSDYISSSTFISDGKETGDITTIDLLVIKPKQFLVLLPNEVEVLSLSVKAKDTVQPGKHLLWVNTKIHLGDTNSTSITNTNAIDIVDSYTLDVQIFGESVISNVIGVPAFFLIPGIIFFSLFRALWDWKHTTNKFPINFKDTKIAFLACAITLSIFMAFLYPIVTDWFGESRSFLGYYGLKDIVGIWTFSLSSAFLLWLFIYFYEQAQAKAPNSVKKRLPSWK